MSETLLRRSSNFRLDLLRRIILNASLLVVVVVVGPEMSVSGGDDDSPVLLLLFQWLTLLLLFGLGSKETCGRAPVTTSLLVVLALGSSSF